MLWFKIWVDELKITFFHHVKAFIHFFGCQVFIELVFDYIWILIKQSKSLAIFNVNLLNITRKVISWNDPFGFHIYNDQFIIIGILPW